MRGGAWRGMALLVVLVANGCDRDEDGDGFIQPVDCDDLDPSINPGAEEGCDGLDNDCDELIDEDEAVSWFPDLDGDGWGESEGIGWACEAPEGMTAEEGDCDDERADVHPGAEELCDWLDNDCDGRVDEDC